MHRDPSDDRLQDWLTARIDAMVAVSRSGFTVRLQDWPPVWEVSIPRSEAEETALRLLAGLGRPERVDEVGPDAG